MTGNSSTVFNAKLHKTQFWDRRGADVDGQSGGPILNAPQCRLKDAKQLIDQLKKADINLDVCTKAYKKRIL